MAEHKFEVGDAVESIGGLEEAQQPSSPCARDAACGECAKLKREVIDERAKSADWIGMNKRLGAERDRLLADVAHLERELERLRKRKP